MLLKAQVESYRYFKSRGEEEEEEEDTTSRGRPSPRQRAALESDMTTTCRHRINHPDSQLLPRHLLFSRLSYARNSDLALTVLLPSLDIQDLVLDCYRLCNSHHLYYCHPWAISDHL